MVYFAQLACGLKTFGRLVRHTFFAGKKLYRNPGVEREQRLKQIFRGFFATLKNVHQSAV
ncbi:MAG TPA: hypothetical protein DD440_03175 [Porticoccaceae bacterium]|nr:hypothetical protein [Porticoccaceae bacterium]